MKKYVFTFLILFFVLSLKNVSAYGFEGFYECYKGGTLLNKSNFSIDANGDVFWKCNAGFTNVNFYFNVVNGGMTGSNGETATYSFVPSSPLGISSGFDIGNTNNACLVSNNKVICPSTITNGRDAFALFVNDSGSYWHVMKNFNFASADESASLSTFQAQQSLQNNTNNAINNSTNSINSNSNNNKNEIINNQNAQFNELKEKQDEAHETSKGILCFFSSIFDSIVNMAKSLVELPGKIFEFLKSIFIPEAKCHTSKNMFNKNSGFQLGYIDSSNKFISANNNALFDYIEVKPNTTYTLSFKGSITGATSVLFYEDKSLIRRDSSRKTFNFTTTEDTKYIRLFFNYDGVTTMTQEVIDSLEIMLTEGETIESYEPFGEICEETSFFTWFERLGNIIGGFFSNLTTSISQFFKDLLTGILEGLKSLFVPSNEQLYEIINESKELTENFGFVGESVNFFINIFTSFLGLVNSSGCIELPEFSVGATSLFDKITFWNAQNVCLSDNVILSRHIETIRTVTSIVLVSLFLGFAASKFFKILNKNDNVQASNDAFDLR